MTGRDERGLGRTLKALLPAREITVAYNIAMQAVPFVVKYGIGSRLRRSCAPYRMLQPTDTVVQIGNARDILYAGRNRAVHFAKCVPQGRVIAIEADSESCQALRDIVHRHKLDNIEVVHSGAWKCKTTLAFFSSPKHPAANLICDVKDSQGVTEEIIRKRQYERCLIEVDTVDAILEHAGVRTPTLVSITTNGAELEIIAGMQKTLASGCRFISLAETGDGLMEKMAELGYGYIARDDRGYCFEQLPMASPRAA